MSVVTFSADLHEYRVDGRVVPSVSEVLKAAQLGPDYSAIDPDVLARAAARGVHVEQCCQLWSEGVLDETSVHPEAVGYVDAFKRAVTVERIECVAWQQVGYCECDEVAGTADLIARVRGAWSILDLKCVSKLDRSYRVQLVAYARMHGFDPDEPDRHTNAPRYVLHLKRDGYTLKDCDDWARKEGAEDETTWLAAVALYRWKHYGNGRK